MTNNTDDCSESSLANKHFLKVADLAALEEDYYKSITNYERIARQSITNNLMKWSVKDYFLKAGICHLATKVRPEILCRSLSIQIVNLISSSGSG